MGSLKQVAQVSKPKKSSKEDSTYRKGLARILRGFDDGLQAYDRMENALEFLNPEWENRDQKFIRKFSMWAKDANSEMSTKDLLDLTKFGASKVPVAVSTIATNLKIPFKDAFFRCVALASLGLAERNPDDKSGRTFRVLFAPSELMRFALNVLNFAAFDDEEVAALAHFFNPELEAKKSGFAIRLIAQAINAKNEYEAHPTNSTDIAAIAHAVKLHLAQHHVPQPVGRLARELGLPTGVVSFVILLLAATDEAVCRGRAEPYWSREHSISLLQVFYDEVGDDIEIGELEHGAAKALLTAAAEQSPDIGQMPRDKAKALLQHAALQAKGTHLPVCPDCGKAMQVSDLDTKAWFCGACRDEEEGTGFDPEDCEHEGLDKDGNCTECGYAVLPTTAMKCPECGEDMQRMEDPTEGFGWLCEKDVSVITDSGLFIDSRSLEPKILENESEDDDAACEECGEERVWDDFLGRWMCGNDECEAYDDDWDADHGSDDEDEDDDEDVDVVALHQQLLAAPANEGRVRGIEARCDVLEATIKSMEARLWSQERDLVDCQERSNELLRQLTNLTVATGNHIHTPNAHTRRELERAQEKAAERIADKRAALFDDHSKADEDADGKS